MPLLRDADANGPYGLRKVIGRVPRCKDLVRRVRTPAVADQ